MDNILNISEEATIRYMTSLAQFGYKKYSEVNKLLVLLFAEELLNSELAENITQDDYRSITNALYCIISNTCLADLPVFETFDSFTHTSTDSNQRLRKSLSNVLRDVVGTTIFRKQI